MNILKTFVLIFGGFLVSVNPVLAQVKTSSISGVAVDSLGAVVAAALVTLRHMDGKNVSSVMFRTSNTDSEGRYRFDGIPFGSYQLEATGFVGKKSLRQIEMTSETELTVNFEIVIEPCAGNGDKVTNLTISDNDKGEIIRDLLDKTLASIQQRPKKHIPSMLMLVPENIDPGWLSPQQLKKVRILDRTDIQKITEQRGGQEYYSISKMTQRGQCIAVTVNNNITVKGQEEDANMAGGGSVFEFRKVAERWEGTFFSGWIS